jgi:hypothetical protein
MRPGVLVPCAAAAAILAGVILMPMLSDSWTGNGSIPLAVLGDSDSHIYRDPVLGVRRGGAYHDVTFQWTEILARLRPGAFDMGELGNFGSGRRVARVRVALGMEASAPRKYDYRYNYAESGATCASLRWQSLYLASAMRRAPRRWENGLVVIKLGVNDLGQRAMLPVHAADGLSADAGGRIRACMSEMAGAIGRIRSASGSVRVLLVGIADDSSWPPGSTPWRSDEEVRRIRLVLDAFDDALRDLAGAPGVAFMDDRSWYYRWWADRGADGHPRRSSRSLGGVTPVTNTQGDHPSNLMLQDGHGGTVAMGFWAREFIQAVNAAFALGAPPLLDEEIARLVDPRGDLGLAPPDPATPPAPPALHLPFRELKYSRAELPTFIPPIEAEDAVGSDVSSTAVARVTTPAGRTLPLFGDGRAIQLRPDHPAPGAYRLQLEVRDRWGQVARREVQLTIQ